MFYSKFITCLLNVDSVSKLPEHILYTCDNFAAFLLVLILPNVLDFTKQLINEF